MATAYPRDAEGTVFVRKPTSSFYKLHTDTLDVNGMMYKSEIGRVVRQWAERENLPDGTEVLVQVLRDGGLSRYKIRRGSVTVESA